MKTGTIIRGLLGGLLAFGAVWLAVVLYWRASGATPTVGDLAVCLLGLPLLLIGGFGLARRLRQRAKTRHLAPPAEEAGDAMAAAADDALREDDRVLYLLASAVWMRAGDSGQVLAQALAQPDRPGLHSTLRDRHGLPVFAAGVDGVDPAATQAALRRVLPDPRVFDHLFSPEQQRAIALLDPVAEDLLYAALPPDHEEPPSAPGDRGLHPHAMHHSRSARAVAPVPVASPLRVWLLLPADWPGSVRTACVAWLRDKAGVTGFDGAQVDIKAIPVSAGAEVWQLLDRLAPTRDGDRGHDVHLLLSSHSLVTAEGIERLDARHELLVSGHPEGLIPGEGAAGLLVSGQRPAIDTGGVPPLRLHRLLQAPAGRGRAASRQLAALLQRALAVVGSAVAPMALVFSDADHRPSRSIEIAGAIAATLPELEPIGDARHLGLACGETGAVAPLALLAAAAAQVAADGAPALAVGVADRDARFALAISPAPPPMTAENRRGCPAADSAPADVSAAAAAAIA